MSVFAKKAEYNKPSLQLVISFVLFGLSLVYALSFSNPVYSSSLAGTPSTFLRSFWAPLGMALWVTLDGANEILTNKKKLIYDVFSLAIGIVEAVFVLAVILVYWHWYSDSVPAVVTPRIFASSLTAILVAFSLAYRFITRRGRSFSSFPSDNLVFYLFALTTACLAAAFFPLSVYLTLDNDLSTYNFVFIVITIGVFTLGLFSVFYVFTSKRAIQEIVLSRMSFSISMIGLLVSLISLFTSVIGYQQNYLSYQQFYWCLASDIFISVVCLASGYYFSYVSHRISA